MFGRQCAYYSVTSIFFAFGGTTTVGILVARPTSMLVSDEMILMSAMCWFLVTFTALPRLLQLFPFNLILHVLLAISWSRVIIFGVSVARQVYPDTHISWVVMGTIAGAAGGILENIERQIWQDHPLPWDPTYQPPPARPSSVTAAYPRRSASKVASFGAGLFTVCTADSGIGASFAHALRLPSPLLSDDHASILVGLYITLWSFSSLVMGHRVDPWYFLELAFSTVANGVKAALGEQAAPTTKRKRPQKPPKEIRKTQ